MRAILSTCLLALTLSLAGCGDDIFNLGDLSSNTGDMTMTTLYRLVSGMYTINKVYDATNDGCMIGPMALVNSPWTLTNDGKGNIDVEGFGAGMVAFNMGTLTKTTMTTGTTTCPSYTIMRTSNMTVTADNTFTLDFTENDSGRGTGCMPVVGATCTSKWKMDFKM